MGQLFQGSTKKDRTEEAGEMAGETATDPILLAAAASVLLSWYEFFTRGNRERGLFVALWPPTILAFASYFKQTEMESRFDKF